MKAPRLWIEFADGEIVDLPLVWDAAEGVFAAAPLDVSASRPLRRVYVVTEELIRVFDAIETVEAAL